MAKNKRFVGIVISADLADRIGKSAKRQGRRYSEEIEARLRPFYYGAGDAAEEYAADIDSLRENGEPCPDISH